VKKGFAIEIQEGLTDVENKQAIEAANKFIKDWIEHYGKWGKATRGGWMSYQRRGKLGEKIKTHDGKNWIDHGLYLRRASRGRRIYQIVRGSDLTVPPQIVDRRGLRGNPEQHPGGLSGGCDCPYHNGSLKVSTKYGDIKTKPYCIIGEIKG
jgi:hypothetical protein